jgi:hypothetical protein
MPLALQASSNHNRDAARRVLLRFRYHAARERSSATLRAPARAPPRLIGLVGRARHDPPEETAWSYSP